MLAPAQILETRALLETSAGALAAGVGIPAAVSFALLGVSRAPDLWREGDYLRGSLYGALAGFALIATSTLLVIGLLIVIDGPTSG